MSAESAEQNKPVPGVASQETQEAFDTTPFEVAEDVVPERPETPVQLTEFVGRYNQAVQYAREHGSPAPPKIAVLVLDADGLKEANDAFGHLGGDQVLAGIRTKLEATIRQPRTTEETQEALAKIPGQKDRRAQAAVSDEIVDIMQAATTERPHHRGDEWLILLKGVETQEQLDMIAERFKDAIRAHVIDKIAPEGIRVSIGGKIYEGEPVDEFYAAADSRMFDDKMMGRGERGAGMPPAVQEELLRRVAWRQLELGRLGLLGAGKLPSERTMSGIVEAMCGNPVVLAMIEEAFNRSNEPSSSDESAKPQVQA